MTDNAERKAIEAYFTAQWASATPIMYDGHTGEAAADSVRLTIVNGAVLQGTIGRTSNRLDHVGTVVVSIYTEGGAGSANWRAYSEAVKEMFRDKRIDGDGAIATASADVFIRFSPQDQHPYISASFDDAPFHITNVTVPFNRYELS